MAVRTVHVEPTFRPWYSGAALTLPPSAMTPEQRALRQFGRKCRVDRIRAHIAQMPSRPLFDDEAVSNQARGQ